MNIISNNQTDLEKFFKSRNMIITILVATSLLQAVHTAMVINYLTFLPDGYLSWIHSAALAICVEIYIVVFSVRNNEYLAKLYLYFAVLINIGMAYISNGVTFHGAFYAVITAVFPMSVYYTAVELGKKMHTPKPAAVNKKRNKK